MAEKKTNKGKTNEVVTSVGKKTVFFVASECVPFAKTGGLADVVGTLPAELSKLDLNVAVFLPFHSAIKAKYAETVEHLISFEVHLGWKARFVGVSKLIHNGTTYYFIDNQDYFGGPIYKGGDDESEQYAFYCRAVCEAMLRLSLIPDVLHLHDWQTGMLPVLIKTQYNTTALNSTKIIFTIHNMMYQGRCGYEFLASTLGIAPQYYTPEYLELNGCANMMKGGLVFADGITTVSPTYANEIKHPSFAYELDGILNARAHQLVGIVNGIDTTSFDPENDKDIPANFTMNNLSGKETCKKKLMEQLGLHTHNLAKTGGSTPLIGIVSRLTSQKGFDLVKHVFHEIMQQNVSVVILGTGEEEFENFFKQMEHEYKGRVCAFIGYNEAVAHQIYAGCDLFLMPSKFEPCGISQMLAQRYGTLPIVRKTGGLNDTVMPFNEFTGEGDGFAFDNYNAHDMLNVIKYALWCWQDDEKRNLLVKNAMSIDNSFAVSALKYRDLYFNL